MVDPNMGGTVSVILARKLYKMKKNFISVLQVSFMVLVAILSFALSACSNDDDDNTDDGNGSSKVSVKYAATGTVNTYQVISADYVDYSASQIVSSNEICFSAVFKESENATSWYEFQFLVEKYKDTDNGEVKDFTGIGNLKAGSHLIISSRKLFKSTWYCNCKKYQWQEFDT